MVAMEYLDVSFYFGCAEKIYVVFNSRNFCVGFNKKTDSEKKETARRVSGGGGQRCFTMPNISLINIGKH